jgi:putative PEP-CTERM system TPR-repeat lipoprotein
MFLKRFGLLVVILLLFACNNQSKEELLQSGIKLLEEGNARGSIVYLKNALEKDPNFYEARYHLANAYLKSGRLDRAESEFRKVSLQSSSFTDLPIKFAEIYLLTSRNELAIQTLKQFHLETAATSESLNLQGRAYALTGDYKTADQSFQKAMALDPSNPKPKIDLVKSLLRQSMDDEAYQLLLKIVEQHQDFAPGSELLASLELKRKQPLRAKNIYRYLYGLDPMNVNALYMQGFIPLMSGRLDESIPVSERLLTEFPDDYRTSLLRGMIAYHQDAFDDALINLTASLQANQTALGYYFVGLSYFRTDKLELSINQFQKVLDVQPDLSQARLMLAMIFLRQKRIDDCIREVRYVITNDERNGLAYNILGSAQMLNKEFDAALQSFDRAIEIDPGVADVYLNKGRAQITSGETELAESVLQEALSLSPGILNARLILASLYVHRENYIDAVEILQEGLAGTAADALLYNYLAGIFFKQKDSETALINLKKAKSADPAYLTPSFNLASYYLAKAEYDKAISEFLSILSQDSGNFNSLIGLGLTYELTGQVELATSIYDRMLESRDPQAAFHVSQHYIRGKRYNEALNLIDSALRNTPSSILLNELKAFTLLKTGQTDKAQGTLEYLEKLESGRGYPKLITLLLKQGQNAQADKIAENVIKIHPESNYGYLLYSSIFETRRQFDRAVEILKQGLSAVSGDARLSLQLGRVYEKIRNTNEAIGVYQEIIGSNPDYYLGFFSLGALYDRLGNKKEAQAFYQKTIALNDRYVPALNNLAYLYADNYGDKAMALELSLQAYQLAPEQQDVLDTLGYTLLKNNKADEAINILEKANNVDIYNPTISYHLALAYIELRQTEKAITELEKSLEGGDFPEAEKCRRLLQKLKT